MSGVLAGALVVALVVVLVALILMSRRIDGLVSRVSKNETRFTPIMEEIERLRSSRWTDSGEGEA